MILLLWVYLISLECNSALSEFDSRFRAYDVVEIDSRKLHKRSLLVNSRMSTINVRYLDKLFKLNVEPRHDVLHDNFTAYSVQKDGHRKIDSPYPFDYLKGHVEGCSISWVRMTLTEMGPIGSFRCEDSIYYMEPAVIHDHNRKVTETIVYRALDVVSTLRTPIDFPPWAADELESFTPRRRRDAAPNLMNNRCSMKIVADFNFFQKVGNGSQAFTTRYIANMLERVNGIYTQTYFGEDFEGNRLYNLGFNIKEIKILEEPNPDPDHYNTNKSLADPWDANELLIAFTSREASDDYCIVHLLTAQPTKNGALGLAYVADSQSWSAGMCARQMPSSPYLYNTLFSSVAATVGNQLLLTREADIVTAHELGHVWGAKHDLEGGGCNHDAGGFYIMNPYAVAGYDENNIRFSKCSVESMQRILSRRADECFIEAPSSSCGNGVQEDGEECDEGLLMPGEHGHCCNRNCRLMAGAKCSSVNHDCCTENCQFKPKNEVCSESNLLMCRLESKCSGNSSTCPEPLPAPNFSLCVDGGECFEGVCKPYCERVSIGKKACMCTEQEFACRRCCRAIDSSLCAPLEDGHVLRDGTFCAQGTCMNSVCVRTEVDVIKHVWSVLEGIDRSNIWDFIKTNLVAFVVILSLLIWCPIGILISNWDRRSDSARSSPAIYKKVFAKVKKKNKKD